MSRQKSTTTKPKPKKQEQPADWQDVHLLKPMNPKITVFRCGFRMSAATARQYFGGLFGRLPSMREIDEIEMHIAIDRRAKKGGAR